MTGWSSPPVDDVGYIPARDLLAKADDELRAVIDRMRTARYEGWRNYKGLWREIMGLDISGRRVLDYGCGVGMEALELAKAGNEVTIADIEPCNIILAYHILQMHGFSARWRLLHRQPPFIENAGEFDTVNFSGVLHHIPCDREVMKRVHGLLGDDGVVRLMLYSDHGWRIATGTEPPEDVRASPEFTRFVRFFDGVGDYATWYDEAKLQRLFGDWFTVERCAYMTPDNRYLGAVLQKKSQPQSDRQPWDRS